ncbi:MAG: carboxypeptidase regulatory-like domain-containing protein [Deltaproteobacteria bacterium]|nr:carboxypeptidase regulatory-like domain-containing protein [Deltaproteobacteria bacterium]
MNARILFLAILAAGCTESSFYTKPPDLTEPRPGSILGRVCDPSGRTWLPDAQVYTYLYTDQGRIYDTRQTYSDRDGFWLLDELPPEHEYQVFVQHGYEILEKVKVYVADGEDVVLDEPDCFDPLAVDVAVVTGDYDDFQDVLIAMGFANYAIVNGIDPYETQDFLLDSVGLQTYDVIFFNSGFVEEDVIYDTDKTDKEGITDTIRENLMAYVTAGGAVYASDWAYDVVEQIWPARINWVGNDDIPDDAQRGEYGVVNAAVSDSQLSEFLGKSYVEVEFDLPVWPVMENVDGSVSIHLSGSVEYREGTNSYVLPSAPILVSFTSGEGKVVTSTFRVAKNASDDIMVVIQYLMYAL